jgi:transposase
MFWHEVSTKIGGHQAVEEDDQKLRVRLVGRDGRRRYDPASRDRLVAACLEPGISVSRLALEHGINANLLRKWIKKAKEVRPLPPSSTSAFVPVQVTRDRSLPMQSSAFALDMPATRGDERLAESERKGPFSFPAKVSASLPNGVKLTLECSDVDALAAIIGALGHVQTGR